MFDRKALIQVAASLFVLYAISAGLALASQSISFGSGQGTLYYTASESSGVCGYSGNLGFTYWTYTGFYYTDPNGKNWSYPNETAEYYNSPGAQSGCPPSGAEPSTLTFGDNGFVIGFHPGSAGAGTAGISFQGSLYPKYEVLSVFYAPPGSESTADYSTTTMVGFSSTLSNSLTSSVTESVTESESLNAIFGTGSLSGTSSVGYNQEADSSTSIDLTYAADQGITVRGPASDSLGLDHYDDLVAVWLNPVNNLTVTPGSLSWQDYAYDGRDPAANLDVQYPSCDELLNPGDMPTTLLDFFDKSWDTDGPGTLTPTDFSMIAEQDPYCVNPNLPTVSSTRYTGPVNGGLIPFQEPTSPNQSPTTWHWSSTYQATDSEGRSASTSYTTGFSWSASYSIFGGLFKNELKDSSSVTLTNKWSDLETTKTSQTVKVSVTEPAYGSGYSGPIDFNMYQDNIYGTLMFFPVTQ